MCWWETGYEGPEGEGSFVHEGEGTEQMEHLLSFQVVGGLLRLCKTRGTEESKIFIAHLLVLLRNSFHTFSVYLKCNEKKGLAEIHNNNNKKRKFCLIKCILVRIPWRLPGSTLPGSEKQGKVTLE